MQRIPTWLWLLAAAVGWLFFRGRLSGSSGSSGSIAIPGPGMGTPIGSAADASKLPAKPSQHFSWSELSSVGKPVNAQLAVNLLGLAGVLESLRLVKGEPLHVDRGFDIDLPEYADAGSAYVEPVTISAAGVKAIQDKAAKLQSLGIIGHVGFFPDGVYVSIADSASPHWTEAGKTAVTSRGGPSFRDAETAGPPAQHGGSILQGVSNPALGKTS